MQKLTAHQKQTGLFHNQSQPDPNKQSQNTSRYRLLKMIIGGTTLLVSLTTFYCYQLLRNSIRENLKQNALLQVQQGVAEIDQWLASRKAETTTIANTPILQSMDWSVVEPYLKSEEARLKDFFFFAMVNPDGSYYSTKVGKAPGNLSDRQHIQEGMAGKVYVSNPVISRTLEILMITVVAPVWASSPHRDRPIGVTSGIISIERGIEVVSALKYGSGSYAFALNSEGQPIVHPDRNLIGTPDNPAASFLEAENPDLRRVAQQMVQHKEGIEEVNIDRQKMYMAYAPLNEADWSIALYIPRSNIDSQLRPLEMIALVVAGLIAAMILMLWQVQEFKQRELKRSKAAADSANQAKSEFLSNMSHELRTPLNGILGYAQILKRDRTLSTRQKDGLNIIHQSGEHLLTLINDILDLSKIEARKMELYPSAIHLESFIDSVVGIMRMKALEKDIQFNYEADANLPVSIETDQKRLRQVLLNLIGNAIKFTETGKVTLRVKVASNSSDLSTPSSELNQRITPFRFEISDTGVGMTAQQLQKIFQPFEQVGDTKRRSQGTGLGLAISRQLVELMGGQLNVESQLNVGSTFWFEIPLPITETLPSLGTQKVGQVTGYQGDRRKILIVDDKQANRLVLLNMLEPLGFEVELAENGQEEIEKAQETHPDLILTDLVMPVMNGFDAIAAIRQIPEIKQIPIIAVSASVLEINQNQAQIVDCQAFLAKPVDEQQLLTLLAEQLQLTWTYDSVNPPTEETAITGETDRAEAAALVPPPPEEIEVLYQLAMLGNMKKIRQRAQHLEQLDRKYIPFANQLKELAQGFQEKAILALVEAQMNQGEKS